MIIFINIANKYQFWYLIVYGLKIDIYIIFINQKENFKIKTMCCNCLIFLIKINKNNKKINIIHIYIYDAGLENKYIT